MKIFPCSAYPEHNALDTLRHSATLDQNNAHQLCSNPEEADIIFFVEDAHFDDYLYSKLTAHPYVEQWRDKCFMYNEVDTPYNVLAGLYCSMPHWSFEKNNQQAFPYIKTPNPYIKDIYANNKATERPLLFSFVGRACNGLRKRMIKTSRKQGGTIIDTSDFNVWDSSDWEKQQQGGVFARTMAQSKYVLCPRGLGTSSFRLFESMQAGRAPVIISDSWVPPNHSDWSFVIRIKEREMNTLSQRLSAVAGEAIERGQAGREIWKKHYAPDQIFHTACENLRELKNSTTPSKGAISIIRHGQVCLNDKIARVAAQLRPFSGV